MVFYDKGLNESDELKFDYNVNNVMVFSHQDTILYCIGNDIFQRHPL